MNWLRSMLSLLCACFILSKLRKARESHFFCKGPHHLTPKGLFHQENNACWKFPVPILLLLR
jgi:hypothetical protein